MRGRPRNLRQRVELLEQALVERHSLMFFAIRHVRQRYAERQRALGLKARVDVGEPGEAAQEQRRADQQDD